MLPHTANKTSHSKLKTLSSQTGNPQSIVKECLPFVDLMGGEIVHQSFDVPLNLRIAFKSAVKGAGSTVCYVLQSFMAAYVVGSHYQKECFSNTQNNGFGPNKVVIENFEIPSYEKLRSRRRDVAEKDFKKICYVKSCDEPATVLGVWTVNGNQFWACEDHKCSIWLKDKRWDVVE